MIGAARSNERLVEWAMRFRYGSNIGKLMVLLGCLMYVPLVVILFQPDQLRYAYAYLIPASASVALGLIVLYFTTPDEDKPQNYRAVLARSSWVVLFIWIWGSLVGAAPFALGLHMTFLHALFESVSGWTTVGLSIIDVGATPQIFMFHRCFMQYCGGLGFVLIMVLIISNRDSMNLYDAEGHPDKILPSIRRTAQAIFLVYNICLVVATVAYMLAGLSFFDGLYHAMCGLSTGGFTNKLGSVGDFQSVPVEVITVVLMLVGATNFATLLLFVQGKWRRAFKTTEVRFMLGSLVVVTAVVSADLAIEGGLGLVEGFRQGFFSCVTAMTTTGFSICDFTTWPPAAVGVLIVVMLVGGGFGSTAGGLKLRRAYIMLRVMVQDVRRRVLPSSRVAPMYFTTAQGRNKIDPALVSNTMSMFVMYILVYLIGAIGMCMTSGAPLEGCLFEFASAFSSAGVSVGITSASASNGTLIIEMIGMLLGRLEIVVVFVGFGATWEYLKQWRRQRSRRRL